MECSAKVNVGVKSSVCGTWELKVSASGSHNHCLNEHLWESYAENRTVKNPRLSKDVAVLHKAGANAKGILRYLREQTGKKTTLKDVHNVVQALKTKQNAGLTDDQRAFAALDEFCGQNGGNCAQVLVDSDSNVARVVTFQTAKMKRLFKAFPEVVLVDSTHDTNSNRYKLFSFVVHVFGKGQYVYHTLVESEHKVNLRCVVEIFKQNNPEWRNIRVVMTDKAGHEKEVLREMFPQARQLLCQWHVITWLKKQAERLAKTSKKEIKGLVSILVYVRSADEYDNAKGAILEQLGGNEDHTLYKTFLENLDSSQDEWVSYRRGNVPHLTNNTNNRIESKWGKIKDVIKDTFTIDQLVSTLITLQEYAEEQYIAEYHRVGGVPSSFSDDSELTSLALQISGFAFKLVEQYKLAAGPDANHNMDIGSSGKTTLTSPRSVTRTKSTPWCV